MRSKIALQSDFWKTNCISTASSLTTYPHTTAVAGQKYWGHVALTRPQTSPHSWAFLMRYFGKTLDAKPWGKMLGTCRAIRIKRDLVSVKRDLISVKRDLVSVNPGGKC